MSGSDSRGAAAATRRPLPQEGTHERPPEREREWQREGPKEPGLPQGPERERDDGKHDPVEPDERAPDGGPDDGKQA